MCYGSAKDVARETGQRQEAQGRPAGEGFCRCAGRLRYLLVSTPREVDQFVRRIPAGRFVDPREPRQKMAAKYVAAAACPVSAGIFLRIVGEAAWEQIQKDKDTSDVTPFWRVVAPGSSLEQRLSCGRAVRKEDATAGGDRGVLMQKLAGSFYVLMLYDVAEEINLSALSAMIRGEPRAASPASGIPLQTT